MMFDSKITCAFRIFLRSFEVIWDLQFRNNLWTLWKNTWRQFKKFCNGFIFNLYKTVTKSRAPSARICPSSLNLIKPRLLARNQGLKKLQLGHLHPHFKLFLGRALLKRVSTTFRAFNPCKEPSTSFSTVRLGSRPSPPFPIQFPSRSLGNLFKQKKFPTGTDTREKRDELYHGPHQLVYIEGKITQKCR